MQLTIISDTHGTHYDLKLKQGDLLIHAGDITEYGTEEEVIDFLKWFAKQPFEHKIFIAGNHDLFLENCSRTKLKKIIPSGIIYLQNSSVDINGLNIYGSPVTPYFLGMAFNKRRGSEILKVWNKIPENTDILITHGPPIGILDNEMGCEELKQRVESIKPTLHLFGHIHEQHGTIQKQETVYVNAAVVNILAPLDNKPCRLVNQPILLTLLNESSRYTSFSGRFKKPVRLY